MFVPFLSQAANMPWVIFAMHLIRNGHAARVMVLKRFVSDTHHE
jgi:hypothetical protein